MEVNKREEEERGIRTPNPNESNRKNTNAYKGKSCKGCLYYSSALKAKSRDPTCVGIPRTIQVPGYIVGETEMKILKEGRNLKNFKFGCVGYSVYLDNKTSSTDQQDSRAKLPYCVGLEILNEVVEVPAHVPSTAAHVPAHVHKNKDGRGIPEPRQYKPIPSTGDAYFNRFKKSAGLVASGVVKNVNKVGSYLKESLDDILYRRPK